MPGPLPKRSAERRRRNKVPGETVVERDGPVKPAPLPRGLHPVARRWYKAIEASGQSEYFEPSDWAAAVVVAVRLSDHLRAEEPSAAMFSAIWSAMESLLTTEAARRKARIEVERAIAEEDVPAGVTAIATYRKVLGG